MNNERGTGLTTDSALARRLEGGKDRRAWPLADRSREVTLRRQIVVSIGFAAMICAPSLAQTTLDSEAWLTAPASAENAGAVRWRVTAESASGTPVVIGSGTAGEDREISAIASQIDFYPFGDEFYLSAGTVTPHDRARFPAWMRRNGQPADIFPHAELAETASPSQIEELTRYFGAGVTVRTIDDWSLTVEGGAYFQDGGEDRMVLFDPETGERMPLLEDLDRIDAEAIGENQSRSVRPVGHLVLRRRF